MRRILGLTAIILSSLSGLAYAQAPAASAPAKAASLPTAADFARSPRFSDVSVSPDGRHMAVIVRHANGRDVLGVMPLVPVGEVKGLASYVDADVLDVMWINNKRLVYSAAAPGAEIKEGAAGSFAVDVDGAEPQQLIAWSRSTQQQGTHIKSRVLPYGWQVVRPFNGQDDDVLVQQVQQDQFGDFKQFRLSRMNTRTLSVRSLDATLPARTNDFLLDGEGQPRVALTRDGADMRMMWRDPGATEWREIAKFDPLKDEALQPWYLGAGNELVVATRRETGYDALFNFDPVTKKLDPQALVAVKGFDLDAAPIVTLNGHALKGLRFAADAPMTYWFDDKVQGLQNAIDSALPKDRFNVLQCASCDARYVVVFSRSDRMPGEYWLYDRDARQISPLGALRPWIDESTQGHRSMQWVTTRDGKRMPVYVTSPAGASPKEPLPTVMLVHGGPYVRGASLAWRAEPQFLASRGYRVIEPEFRGSQGYGGAWFRAGWKQWGQAMQSDLVDALQWAAAQGLSDPKRACVVGGSYGGYAALMAPIATPGVFRCAVSYAGVTDIDLMYSVNWSDASDVVKRYSNPVLIGSPDADAAMLAANSPLKRVAEIKVPVLLMHGVLDRRVPIVHATKFRDAAEKAGVKLTWVRFDEAAHGFSYDKDWQRYYEEMDRFLGAQLGK